MKKFLKRRWHGIPVGVIAVLALVGIVAAASYTFLTFSTEITVDEPLTVEMRWWDYNEGVWTDWWELTGLPGADELDLYMSPGETQTFGLRIYNISYSPLIVHTLITGEVSHFTFDGFPNEEIPGSNGDNSLHEWSSTATITADGDTPSGTYSVAFDFTRE